MECHRRCRGRTMLLGQCRSWDLRAAGNILTSTGHIRKVTTIVRLVQWTGWANPQGIWRQLSLCPLHPNAGLVNRGFTWATQLLVAPHWISNHVLVQLLEPLSRRKGWLGAYFPASPKGTSGTRLPWPCRTAGTPVPGEPRYLSTCPGYGYFHLIH